MATPKHLADRIFFFLLKSGSKTPDEIRRKFNDPELTAIFGDDMKVFCAGFPTLLRFERDGTDERVHPMAWQGMTEEVAVEQFLDFLRKSHGTVCASSIRELIRSKPLLWQFAKRSGGFGCLCARHPEVLHFERSPPPGRYCLASLAPAAAVAPNAPGEGGAATLPVAAGSGAGWRPAVAPPATSSKARSLALRFARWLAEKGGSLDTGAIRGKWQQRLAQDLTHGDLEAFCAAHPDVLRFEGSGGRGTVHVAAGAESLTQTLMKVGLFLASQGGQVPLSEWTRKKHKIPCEVSAVKRLCANFPDSLRLHRHPPPSRVVLLGHAEELPTVQEAAAEQDDASSSSDGPLVTPAVDIEGVSPGATLAAPATGSEGVGHTGAAFAAPATGSEGVRRTGAASAAEDPRSANVARSLARWLAKKGGTLHARQLKGKWRERLWQEPISGDLEAFCARHSDLLCFEGTRCEGTLHVADGAAPLTQTLMKVASFLAANRGEFQVSDWNWRKTKVPCDAVAAKRLCQRFPDALRFDSAPGQGRICLVLDAQGQAAAAGAVGDAEGEASSRSSSP